MQVKGTHFRSIWWSHEDACVQIIDQRVLPHEFKVIALTRFEDYLAAISDMSVRGAPLIGATAAYGMAFAARQDPNEESMADAYTRLLATRPTAVNLKWALDRTLERILPLPASERPDAALALAHHITDEDVEINRQIGVHGLELLKLMAADKPNGEPVNVLTHCNAGWLATVDWGTATSPLYHAHDAGIPIHVWVDETRPRNQGGLTAWEIHSHGIPHTYIVDNAGGHLMQHGQVDIVITGTDRTTRRGDVCNKIGTYLKALAARDNDIPFYVALPSPTIDWTIENGLRDIPIEDRSETEVSHILGTDDNGQIASVRITPTGTSAKNPAFDVTPNHLVTGLITERGISPASAEGLASLFPDLSNES